MDEKIFCCHGGEGSSGTAWEEPATSLAALGQSCLLEDVLPAAWNSSSWGLGLDVTSCKMSPHYSPVLGYTFYIVASTLHGTYVSPFCNEPPAPRGRRR